MYFMILPKYIYNSKIIIQETISKFQLHMEYLCTIPLSDIKIVNCLFLFKLLLTNHHVVLIVKIVCFVVM